MSIMRILSQAQPGPARPSQAQPGPAKIKCFWKYWCNSFVLAQLRPKKWCNNFTGLHHLFKSSNVSENSDAIVLFYCIIHLTSWNMFEKVIAIFQFISFKTNSNLLLQPCAVQTYLIGRPKPGLPSPRCNNLVWLHHQNNKQVQTCLNLVSIWKKLKLAINQLNLFKLVWTYLNLFKHKKAFIEHFWIRFESCLNTLGNPQQN